jgi:hypothetical protein
MLRPDIIIDDGANTQDYNMYSYAKNNPLKYTDPSGWDPDDNGSGSTIFSGSTNFYDVNGNFTGSVSWSGTYNADGSYSGTMYSFDASTGTGTISSFSGVATNNTDASGETSTDGVAVNSNSNSTDQGVGGNVSVPVDKGGSFGPFYVTPGLGGQTTANTSVSIYDNNVPVSIQGMNLLTPDLIAQTNAAQRQLEMPQPYEMPKGDVGGSDGYDPTFDILTLGMGSIAKAGIGAIFSAIVKDEAKYVVYHGIENNVVKYVGITSRDLAVREAEHRAAEGTGKEFLKYEVVDGAENLTKLQARIWEQNLINDYGLEKNGGTLLNKINSIQQKYWGQYGINPLNK